MTQLGESITRIDARAKVTGEAPYPGDINMPGQLWMNVLFARRPHAHIKRLDVSKAQATPGVVRVFTARDAPVNDAPPHIIRPVLLETDLFDSSVDQL